MERTPAPHTKSEMYELYYAGEFGNMLATWASYEAFRKDLEEGLWVPDRRVALRTSSTPGLELPRYCVPTETWEVESLVRDWLRLGVPEGIINLNELADDQRLTLQGEVMRGPRGLELRCTREKQTMRLALAKSQSHYHGLQASMILGRYLDVPSQENLDRLLDTYVDPVRNVVVEFSSYERSVGNLGWNTVFWEVRAY